MTDTRELELWRIVNKAFQNSIEKFGDIFAKDVTRDLLAHGVTMQKWIPVTERLPNYNTFVIVFAEGIVGEAVLDDANYWYWAGTDEYASKIKVTHWMPLPEPPKGE